MLWIQNVTPGERPDNEPHDYVVRINHEPPLGVFQHVRELGAAECLRAAAVAIDGKPTPPAAVVKAMERALRECQDELDAYSRQEYPGDHPVHERYRQRDYDANPARKALADLQAWRDAQ